MIAFHWLPPPGGPGNWGAAHPHLLVCDPAHGTAFQRPLDRGLCGGMKLPVRRYSRRPGVVVTDAQV